MPMSLRMIIQLLALLLLLVFEHALRGMEPTWIRSVVILLIFPVCFLGVRNAWREVKEVRTSLSDQDEHYNSRQNRQADADQMDSSKAIKRKD
jgi:hypothetical protein